MWYIGGVRLWGEEEGEITPSGRWKPKIKRIFFMNGHVCESQYEDATIDIPTKFFSVHFGQIAMPPAK